MYLLCTLNAFFKYHHLKGAVQNFLKKLCESIWKVTKKVATNIRPKNTVDGRNPAPVDMKYDDYNI